MSVRGCRGGRQTGHVAPDSAFLRCGRHARGQRVTIGASRDARLGADSRVVLRDTGTNTELVDRGHLPLSASCAKVLRIRCEIVTKPPEKTLGLSLIDLSLAQCVEVRWLGHLCVLLGPEQFPSPRL
jgi:hypothetical protein